MTIPADTKRLKSRLEAQLAELESRRQRISADLLEPLNPDSSERAVEMEDDASMEGEAKLIEREIVSVKNALRRLETGTYGTCVRCGDPIGVERLEARPEAALCIDCARNG